MPDNYQQVWQRRIESVSKEKHQQAERAAMSDDMTTVLDNINSEEIVEQATELLNSMIEVNPSPENWDADSGRFSIAIIELIKETFGEQMLEATNMGHDRFVEYFSEWAFYVREEAVRRFEERRQD